MRLVNFDLFNEASGSHSMGRNPNKRCDFAEGQKIGHAEAIKTYTWVVII